MNRLLISAGAAMCAILLFVGVINAGAGTSDPSPITGPTKVEVVNDGTQPVPMRPVGSMSVTGQAGRSTTQGYSSFASLALPASPAAPFVGGIVKVSGVR